MHHFDYREGHLFAEGVGCERLAKEYGTPLYVYEEETLRERCRELKNLLKRPNFAVSYSMKANSNVALLEIIRSEGLHVDTMSPGEIFLAMEAGYKAEEILFIGNNMSALGMKIAILSDLDPSSTIDRFSAAVVGEDFNINAPLGFGG